MERDGWGMLARRGRGLAEEANATVRAGRPLDPTWLDSAAGWLAEAARPWQDLTGDEPTGRQYRLVASSLHLEAWLICWPRAGRLELHDHGGACGALRVVDGALSEEFITERRLPARRRCLEAGHGVSFDGDYAHDVVNLGAAMATSVHVYSSASRPMRYYRVSDTGLLALPGQVDDAVVVGDGEMAGPAGRTVPSAGRTIPSAGRSAPGVDQILVPTPSGG